MTAVSAVEARQFSSFQASQGLKLSAWNHKPEALTVGVSLSLRVYSYSLSLSRLVAMANYATIPDEVQPAAKASWRRVVAVATAASFVLGVFALRHV